jgi:hypothetical protein
VDRWQADGQAVKRKIVNAAPVTTEISEAIWSILNADRAALVLTTKPSGK